MLETKTVTIEKGRDEGKTFRIREMSSLQLEKWCARAIIAIFGSESNIPPELVGAMQTSNTVALIQIGVKCMTGLTWDKVESLYDELLKQVDVVVMPDPAKPEVFIRLHDGNVENHVFSAGTIVRLRGEVLALCLGFSTDGVSLDSLQASLLSRLASGAMQTSPMSSAV